MIMKEISLVFVAIICVGIAIISNATFNMANKNDEFCKMYESGQIACSCTILRDTVEFCVSVRKIREIEPAAGERIIVNDRVSAVPGKTADIPMWGPMDDRYFIEITEPNGKRLLTKKEMLALKNNDNLSNIITDVPIVSERHERIRELKAGETLSSEYILSERFILEPNILYKLKVSRKIDQSDTEADIRSKVLTMEFEIPSQKGVSN